MSHTPTRLARLIMASSEQSADLYWATQFYVPDPILYLEHRGKKILVVSDLELGRALKEAEVDRVLPLSRYKLDRLLKELKVRTIHVPSSFPLRQAEVLRRKGYRVIPVPDPFYPERAIKSEEEKRFIVKGLRATESAIRTAVALLKRSKIRGNRIEWEGSRLTSERLRRVIENDLFAHGMLAQNTIVACGRPSADPHQRGSGPLYPHQPIVIDVFPRSTKTGYYGDISRTVVKGHASEALKKMYAAVLKAQRVGIATIRAGVTGAKVHEAVVRSFAEQGFKTKRLGSRPQGFIHSTGHGLGLEIHEPPRLGRGGKKLKKGNVVTVEPGLYYEEVGGVRIEDVVFVTGRGCEVLTKIPKVFIIP